MSVSLGTVYAAVQGAKALAPTLDVIGGKLKAAKSKSYIEYSKVTTIEPPTLIDETLSSHPILPAILNSLLTQFTLYYVQAATIHMNLGRVNIAGKLDPLSPNRSMGFPNISLESEEKNSFLNFGSGIRTYEGLGLEDFSADLSLGKAKLSINAKPDGGKEAGRTSGISTPTDKMIKDSAALSVGRVFDFEIKDGDKTAKIPLTCRLRTGIIRPDSLARLMSLKQLPSGFFARIKSFFEGDKEFWRDIVLNKDLIKEHRDALLRDTTGMYRERLSVARKNRWAAITRMEPSIATLATLYVVSKDTILSMASKYGVDFSRQAVREKVFEDSGAMIIAVVDPMDYEAVTFYYHSLEHSREFTFSQLQREMSSSRGGDVTEIIQALGLLQPGRV
jgi:hypothetical protein